MEAEESALTVNGYQQMHSLENSEMVQLYRDAGFSGRVGWGERPAILVIDLAQAWTSPTEELGSDVEDVVSATTRLLAVAREQDVPIIFTTMAYDPALIGAGPVALAKTPHLKKMISGSDLVQLRPELQKRENEPLVEKPHASAFFGTNVLSMLVGLEADTVIVVGVSTSGCIRSTCESAFNNNFRVILPEEAVADRSHTAHQAALLDIDARMGDVMPLDDVITHLQTIRQG